MKPKVLFFCSDYQVGLTTALAEQAIELNQSNEIDLLCISSEKEMEEGLHEKIKENKVQMTIVPHLDVHSGFRRLTTIIAGIIQVNSITHVNVHNNWQLALVGYLKYRYLIPSKFKIIYTIHGYRHNSSIKSIFAIGVIGFALLALADRVISMSSYVSNKFWFVKYKTDLIFYFMNKPEFNKSRNKIKGSPLLMVFPAQFRYGKRQEILIQAVADYKEQTGDENFRLILPGTGDKWEEMRQLAQQLGVDRQTEFPGKMAHKEVIKLYENSNIALVSSNVETYGRCIAEPFALGRCVITQKTGVALDIIKERRNGMFFTDAKSLAKILVELHTHSEFVEAMGNQAFYDKKVFDKEHILTLYTNTIKKA